MQSIVYGEMRKKNQILLLNKSSEYKQTLV